MSDIYVSQIRDLISPLLCDMVEGKAELYEIAAVVDASVTLLDMAKKYGDVDQNDELWEEATR